MALKEGRCPNCGSILQLDPAAEKGHCLFCDAVFANGTAFEIADNPKGVTFPNLPQPKYEGPSLDPRFGPAAGQPSARLKQVQPAKKAKTAPPIYIPRDPVKLPEIKLSRKTKLRILAISLVVIAIMAAIGIPTVLGRDQARARLVEEMSGIAPLNLDMAQAAVIRRTNNSYLLLATGKSVTQADMIVLFKTYCEKRAAIQNLDAADFRKVYGQVTVRLVTPDGGFLIDRPDDLAALESGSAVVVLDP